MVRDIVHWRQSSNMVFHRVWHSCCNKVNIGRFRVGTECLELTWCYNHSTMFPHQTQSSTWVRPSQSQGSLSIIEEVVLKDIPNPLSCDPGCFYYVGVTLCVTPYQNSDPHFPFSFPKTLVLFPLLSIPILTLTLWSILRTPYACPTSLFHTLSPSTLTKDSIIPPQTALMTLHYS